MKRKLKSILLIEDDPATNFLHARAIRSEDCAENIITAEHGEAALKLLIGLIARNEPAPELLLLDINMPVMNGWEFLTAYAQLPEDFRAGTRIIMLTTSMNPDDEARAGSTPGINGFKLKPLDKAMLHEILEKHFSQQM